MDNKNRIVQYGLGPIGNKITQYLLERDSVQIVGAIDSDPTKLNLDIGELAGSSSAYGVRITGDPKTLLSKVDADIVVLTTTSSLENIKPQILEIVSFGVNIVSTCEELSHPWLTNPKTADEIDVAAKMNDVSVLATGINPGFLMDFLPLAMTGICRNVKKVTVERIQNAQFRRIPFQKKIGAGLTVEQFNDRVKEGTLRHVGLTESIHMIAHKIGWKLDKTEDIIDPVIATEKVTTDELTIEPGKATGVSQTGRGYIENKEVITLIFKATVGESNPRDRIIIEGTPDIDMTIKDGINGDIATCAITANAIPAVIKAPAGLKTMANIETISYSC
ncbi:MAG: 2,4-diaminopentanoate dehydrogenase [Candidatus Scalindua arabica]|uniref:2,4-diaminopentanoate dehydrogenase n=1 Tax=Candidatus Scalindua arabica TaxID=1127984 RepID=A0A941W1C8_9BACT|nr:2,4-diaminopentanoate dehydrogenase [Candidatus Scalindua arabica]